MDGLRRQRHFLSGPTLKSHAPQVWERRRFKSSSIHLSAWLRDDTKPPRNRSDNMEFEELKRKSNKKILLYGQTMRGKTVSSSRIALGLASEGIKVKYVDTESEGSSTLVKLIESGEFDEEDVENIEYVVVDNYDELVSEIEEEGGTHDEFGLVVIDSLDHKHSFALKKVTDAKMKSEADWNEYPAIYSTEKQIMEIISKPKTNILATLDPDSGSEDKPKGAQTNIKGYFSIVVELQRGDEKYAGTIENWIGRDEVIMTTHETEDIVSKLVDELSESVVK
jgi:archaellum biogenesis ATPase FlaH